MRVAIARTMAEFSIDVYSNNLISALKTVRPDWEIIELAPRSFDRHSSSLALRIQKYYERFWLYPRRVKKHEADIFHIIEPSDAHLVYWLKQAGKPTVVTCHDLINFYYQGNLKGSVELPIVSRNAWIYSVKGMKQCDRIIAVSAATAKDTHKILDIDPAKITVVPNAVEEIFKPLPKDKVDAFRQQQDVSKDAICLLNVGANHPRKNLDNILQTIAIVKQQGLSVHFWKVGADFTDEQKQFIETHDLSQDVTYLGKPDKAKLVEIYNAADLLVAPSLYEGFGITLLEAMACGTPVLTSNTSAMPEVVGDAGILVDPTDPLKIARSIINLHQDHSYSQTIKEKGLVRVRSFTWKNTAEKVALAYEQLINNTP